MNPKQLLTIAGAGPVIGALLGMAGTFAPSASLRGLAWGIDGAALILASALLTVHHFRIGNDTVAAGFLVFAVGESLMLSVASTDPVAGVPAFDAGASLWTVALALTSAPPLVRALGGFAALLFTAVSVNEVPPNPSTERTSNSGPHPRLATAHVKRQPSRSTHAVRHLHP